MLQIVWEGRCGATGGGAVRPVQDADRKEMTNSDKSLLVKAKFS